MMKLSFLACLIVGTLIAHLALKTDGGCVPQYGPARKINDYAMDHRDYDGKSLIEWYRADFKGQPTFTKRREKLKYSLNIFASFLRFSGPQDCTEEFISLLPKARKLAFSFDGMDDEPHPRIVFLYMKKSEEYRRDCNLPEEEEPWEYRVLRN